MHVVGQHVAVEGHQGFRSGLRVRVIHCLWHVIDDAHHNGAGGGVAQRIRRKVGEAFSQGVRAIVGVRCRARRRSQGVGVGTVGVELNLAIVAGRTAHQCVGDRTDGTGDRADQCSGSGFTGVARLAAGDRTRCQIVAIFGQVQGFFVDRHIGVRRREDFAVADIDGDGGGAFIAVSVAHGVGEHVGRTWRADRVRVAVIGRVAIGIEGQVAVGAVDIGVEPATGRSRRIATGAHAHHGTTGRRTVGATDVVVEHIAADRSAFIDMGRIRLRAWQVIDDVDVDLARSRTAIRVGRHHLEVFADAVRTVRIGMGFAAHQGVAVADHAGDLIKTGDGQVAAQRSNDGVRQTRDHATVHHCITAHGQGLQTVERGHGEGAGLGQCRRVRAGAPVEVFLVDGEFATVHVQTADGHRIVVVMDLQNEVRGAGIAVRVSDRVGEGFRPVATAVQGFEIGIADVQGVGVSAVGVEHQGAVNTGEGAGGDRAGILAGDDTVGALHVVGQHVAVEAQQGFRGGAGVAVVHAFGHIIDDVDVERAIGRGAVVVNHGDGKLLRQIVGAVSIRMGFVIGQGVAVADHAGGGIETGHGQRAAQRRDN